MNNEHLLELHEDFQAHLKKRNGEFAEKLHLLVRVFIVDGDFQHGVNVRHLTAHKHRKSRDTFDIPIISFHLILLKPYSNHKQ